MPDVQRCWQPSGWTETDLPKAAARWALPGVANLHSHAFQRAMAGMAERQLHAQDSFWTWRETMYHFAARITPESLFAIASQLYVEMLEAGYTHVCEFHYLHHQQDGTPFDEPAAMANAIIAAARETGIGLTLLPVLYMTGGFDGRALSERQRGFGHDVDGFLRLLDGLRNRIDGGFEVGVALHSLRAVPEDAMHAVLRAIGAQPMPIHIHIAEQMIEVDECSAARGARPVEWLLRECAVDARWTLVHATHMSEQETFDLACSGATVAICPTTEANLGDGLFPLRDYQIAGGAWGIGSDSNCSISPVEELRWLEYGQRLQLRERSVATTLAHSSTGEALFAGAMHGGERSLQADTDALSRVGGNNWIVLDERAPQLAGAMDDDVIDRFIFSGNRNLVRETWIDGKRLVADGHHRDAERIGARYRQTIARLLA